MAQWGDAKLFFCFLFITGCCTVTLAEEPLVCCLSVLTDRTVPKHVVANYHEQISGQGCSLDAMILVTRNGVKLCAPVNVDWVQGVIEHVDKVRAHCKKMNYKGKRCTGIKP
ncbi:C-C motif chemokine 3-like [Xyrichtys novacula]|uniref:C-C motif chemokine 3-like n=1 Tax=Xyrichtys novacula TaxID=13765 RepID=A0AAV1G7P9_XYRNO|nr:C-C motif chemokine 3-like [Xyrichtys novacula]